MDFKDVHKVRREGRKALQKYRERRRKVTCPGVEEYKSKLRQPPKCECCRTGDAEYQIKEYNKAFFCGTCVRLNGSTVVRELE